jgi:hypothetical protein
MNLTPQEAGRMEYLLGKSRFGYLIPEEQTELRYLVTKEQPSAKNSSLDELIKAGLILVGLYILAKALSEK